MFVRYDSQFLYDQVWEKPPLKVAMEYAVSAVAQCEITFRGLVDLIVKRAISTPTAPVLLPVLLACRARYAAPAA